MSVNTTLFWEAYSRKDNLLEKVLKQGDGCNQWFFQSPLNCTSHSPVCQRKAQSLHWSQVDLCSPFHRDPYSYKAARMEKYFYRLPLPRLLASHDWWAQSLLPNFTTLGQSGPGNNDGWRVSQLKNCKTFQITAPVLCRAVA